MKYIIMCGGKYDKWKTPKQLQKVFKIIRQEDKGGWLKPLCFETDRLTSTRWVMSA